jgi:hypothetical protein
MENMSAGLGDSLEIEKVMKKAAPQRPNRG